MQQKQSDFRRKLPSSEDLAMWRQYLETFEALRTELFARLQNQSGLSQPDYHVLLTLSEASDNRVRSSELAFKLGWDRSRLSHHLRRMENRGLIQRQECKLDGRGAEVAITEEGRKTFRAAAKPHLADVQELFIDALTGIQLKAAGDIADAVQRNLASIEQKENLE